MTAHRFVVEAMRELVEAARWYETETGLGEELHTAVRATVAAAVALPAAGAVVDVRLGIRKRFVERFPYAVIYFIGDDELIVLAVAHMSRRPGYWRRRSRREGLR